MLLQNSCLLINWLCYFLSVDKKNQCVQLKANNLLWKLARKSSLGHSFDLFYTESKTKYSSYYILKLFRNNIYSIMLFLSFKGKTLFEIIETIHTSFFWITNHIKYHTKISYLIRKKQCNYLYVQSHRLISIIAIYVYKPILK